MPNGADHVLVAGSTEGTLPSQTSVGSMDIFLAKAGDQELELSSETI